MTIRQGTTIISGGGGGKVTSVNGEIGDVVVKSVVNEKDNSTQLKFWLGTQEEYEQITEKDASTLYYTSGEDSSAISYNDLTDKPTINTVPLSGDMTLAELGIQGELQAGTGITIENNVISATVVGGVTSVNGQTGDVTVDGLKDQNTVNTGLLKFWTGTKEQYAEIETKDPNTLYYVGETLTPATLATVATTGLYADLLEKPQINTVTLEGNKTSSDLGLQDAETALNYNNITNCITKIPQDIKLEVSGNTITIKAGSKVYYPDGKNEDGTNIFNTLTFSEDKSVTSVQFQSQKNLSVYFNISNQTFIIRFITDGFSGTSDPATNGTYYYNTDTNIITDHASDGATRQVTFPVAIISADETGIITINQVFNGFGFIGSTLFTLPGVEGLCPSGRNEDSTLNNILNSYTQVATVDLSITNDVTIIGWLNTETQNFGTVTESQYFIQNTQPDNIQWTCWFNPNENLIFIGNGNTWQQRNTFISFKVSISDHRIISLTPKLPIQLVNNQEVVHNTGDENVYGIKTFEDNITAPNQVDYTQITNCITKISQDIKLELSNGILTLKAGSKLYIPNGKNASDINRFDEIILDKDYNRSTTTTSTGYTLLYFNKNNQDDNYKLSSVTVTGDATKWSYSGNTAPTEFINDIAYWYDTQNNIVKNTLNSGSSWEEGFSLPIAVISYEPNTFTSIDQVFNGFGFIGSTIFALPGVEGLIPNGRNTDGSLNNIKVTTNSVSILTGMSTGNYILTIRDLGYIDNWSIARYDEDKNIVYRIDNNQQVTLCFCGHLSRNAGRITSFNPKPCFHAVDRNDSSWISQQAMPSDKYIDLTLGASGTSYTAPANGWFYLAKSSSAANQFIAMEGNIGMRIFATDINANLPISISCQKGKSIKISYNVGGTTNIFRFVYAEGEL